MNWGDAFDFFIIGNSLAGVGVWARRSHDSWGMSRLRVRMAVAALGVAIACVVAFAIFEGWSQGLGVTAGIAVGIPLWLWRDRWLARRTNRR